MHFTFFSSSCLGAKKHIFVWINMGNRHVHWRVSTSFYTQQLKVRFPQGMKLKRDCWGLWPNWHLFQRFKDATTVSVWDRFPNIIYLCHLKIPDILRCHLGQCLGPIPKYYISSCFKKFQRFLDATSASVWGRFPNFISLHHSKNSRDPEIPPRPVSARQILKY